MEDTDCQCVPVVCVLNFVRENGAKLSQSYLPGEIRLGFSSIRAVEGKNMDLEPIVGGPVPGFVTDSIPKFGDCSPTDAGSSLPRGHVMLKRKEYLETDENAGKAKTCDRKRMRLSSERASKHKERLKAQMGASFTVDIGGGERKIGGTRSIPSTGCPGPPFHLYDALIKSDRVLHRDPGASETSIASSEDAGYDKRSGGNSSTLTSNEDGDSRTMSFFGAPKADVEVNRFERYSVPSEGELSTGIVRQNLTGARHVSSSGHQTSRWKHTRKPVDDEVISGHRKNGQSLYSARECELNKVFGVSLWKPQEEESVKERRKASAMDSGCSEEAGNENRRDNIDREPDVRTSKLKQVCDKYDRIKSSREHQSSSVVTDLCASSDSVSVWLEGASSLKLSQHFTAGVQTNMSSIAKSDNKVGPTKNAVHLACVQEEQHITSRSQYTSSRSEDTNPASSRSERNETDCTGNMSVGLDESSSGTVPGGSESNKPEPKFVLSSGRRSKTEEAELGKRPTTIDDDFDQYFAQLML